MLKIFNLKSFNGWLAQTIRQCADIKMYLITGQNCTKTYQWKLSAGDYLRLQTLDVVIDDQFHWDKTY